MCRAYPINQSSSLKIGKVAVLVEEVKSEPL